MEMIFFFCSEKRALNVDCLLADPFSSAECVEDV